MKKQVIYLFTSLCITCCDLVSAGHAPFDLFPLNVLNHYSATNFSNSNRDALWFERIFPSNLYFSDISKNDTEYIANTLKNEKNLENPFETPLLLEDNSADYSTDEDLANIIIQPTPDISIRDFINANRDKTLDIKKAVFPVKSLTYNPYFFMLVSDAISYAIDNKPPLSDELDLDEDFFKETLEDSYIEEKYLPPLSSVVVNPQNNEFDDILDGLYDGSEILEISEDELNDFKYEISNYPIESNIKPSVRAYREPFQDNTNAPVRAYREPFQDNANASVREYREPFQDNTNTTVRAYREPFQDNTNAPVGAYRESFQDNTNAPVGAYRESFQDNANAPVGAYRESFQDNTNAPVGAYRESFQDNTNAPVGEDSKNSMMVNNDAYINELEAVDAQNEIDQNKILNVDGDFEIDYASPEVNEGVNHIITPGSMVEYNNSDEFFYVTD